MFLLLNFIQMCFFVYTILIIIYVFMSWLPQLRQSVVGEMIGRVVEPYLSVFRRFIPPLGMIDLSPIIAIFALRFVQQGVIALILLIANPGQIGNFFGNLF